MERPPAKVSYLGLLNGIAVAEHHGHAYFSAWAQATKDAELAAVLKLVAVREIEHYWAFRKRLIELGYDVRFPADGHERRARDIEIAGSSASDAEKWEYFDVGVQYDDDPFDKMFTNKTLDPTTGGLLGRYIAEERDSTRLLAVRRAATFAALKQT